jgi:hypothetical protein
MRYSCLGESGLQVSVAGLGCNEIDRIVPPPASAG